MKDRDPRTIPIDQLKVGQHYIGRGRNIDHGTWDGKAFQGYRFKFGQRFLDGELHWDACTHHGTFQPYEETDEEPRK